MSISIGTPFSETATRVLLCGSGELGKEVVIELQRLGCEVIAVDRYANAPAMQVADRSHVINMLDGAALRNVIEKEKPHLVVPEIEAIATDTLAELETEGVNIVPSARATQLTMNREGIRCLAAETLSIPTSSYRFAATESEFIQAVKTIGLPCLVKPIMSSSGKGQSFVKTEGEISRAWQYAQEGGRSGKGKVIVEGFVDFDFEITLLTVRAKDAQGDIQTYYCEPIGHRQEKGDYVESWQPQAMTPAALAAAQSVAKSITEALGGLGLFGVELFVKGDDVWFSEVSPRPHDTGMVTMCSQRLSEFELHARAILGLPVDVSLSKPGASAVIYGGVESTQLSFANVDKALVTPESDIRLFGKPAAFVRRRMGVALATGVDTAEARARAKTAATTVMPQVDAC